VIASGFFSGGSKVSVIGRGYRFGVVRVDSFVFVLIDATGCAGCTVAASAAATSTFCWL
jgi:hypothetical protein